MLCILTSALMLCPWILVKINQKCFKIPTFLVGIINCCLHRVVNLGLLTLNADALSTTLWHPIPILKLYIMFIYNSLYSLGSIISDKCLKTAIHWFLKLCLFSKFGSSVQKSQKVLWIILKLNFFSKFVTIYLSALSLNINCRFY